MITDPGYDKPFGGNCTTTGDQYLKGVCKMLWQSSHRTGAD